jgi:hypothetical protein
MVTSLKKNHCCFSIDAVGIAMVFLQMEHPGIVFQTQMYFQRAGAFAVYLFCNALINS